MERSNVGRLVGQSTSLRQRRVHGYPVERTPHGVGNRIDGRVRAIRLSHDLSCASTTTIIVLPIRKRSTVFVVHATIWLLAVHTVRIHWREWKLRRKVQKWEDEGGW